MIKVLVVDDEISISDYLKNFLTERQYDVSTASSGEEALKKIKEEEPQVMLLDVRMPGLSGFDTLKQARQLDKDLKVIMLTGVENEEMMKLARELGADDYVTKPFSLDHLEKDVLKKILSLLSAK